MPVVEEIAVGSHLPEATGNEGGLIGVWIRVEDGMEADFGWKKKNLLLVAVVIAWRGWYKC